MNCGPQKFNQHIKVSMLTWTKKPVYNENVYPSHIKKFS